MAKKSLSSACWVTYWMQKRISEYSLRSLVCIAAQTDNAVRPEKYPQHGEKVLTGSSFTNVMWSVCEWASCRKGVKRKDVPQENGFIDLLQHVPDGASGLFSNGISESRAYPRKIPAFDVLTEMHIVGQGKSGTAPTAMTGLATEPQICT